MDSVKDSFMQHTTSLLKSMHQRDAFNPVRFVQIRGKTDGHNNPICQSMFKPIVYLALFSQVAFALNRDWPVFCTTLDSSSKLATIYENANSEDFAFTTSEFKSLRALMASRASICATSSVVHVDYVDEAIKNGRVSYQGACELWCDDARILHDDKCTIDFDSMDLGVDSSKCQTAKQLSLYTPTQETPSWQLCVTCNVAKSSQHVLDNSEEAPTSEPSSDPFETPASTSSPSDSYPSISTSTPSPSNSPSDSYPRNSTSAPSPSNSTITPSPSNSTSAPSTITAPSTAPPATPAPSNSASTPPPSKTPSNGVAKPYGQCGGIGFTGATACSDGFVCSKKSDYFSLCDLGAQSGNVPIWGQCGGKLFTGSTQCNPNAQCKAVNDYYSQCIPK
ncbi:hypothetical protein AC1031_005771 [Aphanomyces cochlioides]|nr:hypothetical protein AC1031_005771 [Aphanomyces cochlioides]